MATPILPYNQHFHSATVKMNKVYIKTLFIYMCGYIGLCVNKYISERCHIIKNLTSGKVTYWFSRSYTQFRAGVLMNRSWQGLSMTVGFVWYIFLCQFYMSFQLRVSVGIFNHFPTIRQTLALRRKELVRIFIWRQAIIKLKPLKRCLNISITFLSEICFTYQLIKMLETIIRELSSNLFIFNSGTCPLVQSNCLLRKFFIFRQGRYFVFNHNNKCLKESVRSCWAKEQSAVNHIGGRIMLWGSQ